jgi:hypothetical protein
MALDIIGLIHVINDDETVTTLDGWYVNSTEILKGLDDYLVIPKVPMRITSGVKTFFYKFDSQKQAEVFLSDYLPEQEDI